ncbi:peptidoglycan DD-metalloendopeptidase family protein [Vogesella sp. LIG4]|uniref:peptidoglycan DD-metalloendopeptidase family protein n=1 Tax=Vogesella sp. LIG4 TaxID=1192162 RepID=UPI0008200439|nr:peptidoglycan DD-metalloendopeptidase family protein [Vogesella sp. LIG4]SCK07872.1 lipoprotein NlpD [Vogesella sp. LIG4]
MQNYSRRNPVYRFSPLLGVLLLSACAQFQQDTPAQIVRGTPSVLGGYGNSSQNAGTPAKTGTAAPAGNNKVTTQAIAIGNGPQARPVAGGNTSHTVQPGETLYRVAVNNGLRYQDLAEWNHLDGYTIKVGQVLRLTPPGTASAPLSGQSVKPVESKPANGQAPVDAQAPSGAEAAVNRADSKRYPKALKLPYSEEASKSLPALSEGNGKTASPPQASAPATAKATPKAEASAPVTPAPGAADDKAKTAGPVWGWPTQGSVIRGFSDQNKGIDIGGRTGQPVVAAADGKVVYSGNGLRGYGKLIILRHDKTYLSAYAHNSQLLVKEGQSVKKGQKIAEMGNTDTDQVKLHFEIRQLGKPVDPSKFLEQRP